MGKREFRNYIQQLNRKAMGEQLMEVYQRFPEVKEFYDFILKPEEDKLVNAAKIKIKKEYFPINGRKPRKRRSVAQKLIRHYDRLGVEEHHLLDIMLFNLETALSFMENKNLSKSFAKSLQNSYDQALAYCTHNNLQASNNQRLKSIESKLFELIGNII